MTRVMRNMWKCDARLTRLLYSTSWVWGCNSIREHTQHNPLIYTLPKLTLFPGTVVFWFWQVILYINILFFSLLTTLLYKQVVLCFSPVGASLRVRSRKFPALTNCTSINWFHEWPEDALISVSARFLEEADFSVSLLEYFLANIL